MALRIVVLDTGNYKSAHCLSSALRAAYPVSRTESMRTLLQCMCRIVDICMAILAKCAPELQNLSM